MAIHTTYTDARAKLAELWNQVTHNNEVVVISRRGAESVALVSASELAGLIEAAHLLRSSENAERLLRALGRARTRTVAPGDLEELYQEIGIEKESMKRGKRH
jgi:antitoxin YefM